MSRSVRRIAYLPFRRLAHRHLWPSSSFEWNNFASVGYMSCAFFFPPRCSKTLCYVMGERWRRGALSDFLCGENWPITGGLQTQWQRLLFGEVLTLVLLLTGLHVTAQVWHAEALFVGLQQRYCFPLPHPAIILLLLFLFVMWSSNSLSSNQSSHQSHNLVLTRFCSYDNFGPWTIRLNQTLWAFSLWEISGCSYQSIHERKSTDSLKKSCFCDAPTGTRVQRLNSNKPEIVRKSHVTTNVVWLLVIHLG